MRSNFKTLVVGAVIGAVFGSAPAIANAVADYARNADKVDGFHAVGARKPKQQRGRKIVATNRFGELPSDIIAVAPDSRELDGRLPEEFTRACKGSAVTGAAYVDPTVGSEFEEVAGHEYAVTHIPPLHDLANPACRSWGPPEARRLGTGVFEVRFDATPLGCENHEPSSTLATPHDPSTVLVATTATVCDEGRIVERVRIADLDGTPQDAPFTLAVLSEREIFLP